MKTPVCLGTPLSPSATKVMLLGSGELGKEVIISLQRLSKSLQLTVIRMPPVTRLPIAHTLST